METVSVVRANVVSTAATAGPAIMAIFMVYHAIPSVACTYVGTQ